MQAAMFNYLLSCRGAENCSRYQQLLNEVSSGNRMTWFHVRTMFRAFSEKEKARERQIRKEIWDAQWWLRATMRVSGMYPFQGKDGYLEFKWCSVPVLHFLVSSLFMSFVLLLVIISVGSLWFGSHPEAQVLFEELKDENSLTLILITGMLVMAVLNSYAFLSRANSFIRHWDHWVRFIQETGLSPVGGLRAKAILYTSLLNTSVSIILIILITGTPGTLRSTVFEQARLFEKLIMNLPNEQQLWQTKGMCIIYTVLVVHAKLALILHFMVECRMLSIVQDMWIERLQEFLKSRQKRVRHHQDATRHLMQPQREIRSIDIESDDEDDDDRRLDHLIVSYREFCNLLREGDCLYGPITTIYFATQVVLICLSLYVDTTQQDEPTEEKVYMAAMTIAKIVMFYVVAIIPSEIPEQCWRIRNLLRGGLPNVNEADGEERLRKFELLMSSMTGPTVAMSGSRFFILDRGAILSMMAAIITFFVVFLQFGPECAQRSPT